jgi:hypothetical protein
MNFTPDDYPEYTLHIVLTTTPQRQEEAFEKQVEKVFFENYRNDAGKYFQKNGIDYGKHPNHEDVTVLYNPLKFYLLGNFDLAYITLIDNLKFAQKVFEPHPKETEKPLIFSTHSFQSLTGITYATGHELVDFFYQKLTVNKKYFVSICNLKLNNGFLIGNGKEFIQPVKDKIRSIIQDVNDDGAHLDYLILHCFSWFELSVILFTDNPAEVPAVVKQLRRLTVNNLGNDELIKNSLYAELLKEDNEEVNVGEANVFADTQTYHGIHSDLVHAEDGDEFLERFRTLNPELETEIEWQLKPGHMDLLAKELEKWQQSFPEPIFDLTTRHMLAGKSDYLLKRTTSFANDNLELLRFIIKNPQNTLFDHVRKIRTRIFFKDKFDTSKPEKKVINITPILARLGVTNNEMESLDKNLKALKISRQIRAKVFKIFSNFNNGIQDPILFPYFLDFYIFIRELKQLIKEEFAAWSKYLENGTLKDAPVQFLEAALVKRIEVFQEGYNIRMMNCYQFEDITNFDVTINTSIQQLLSAYSTLAHELGNMFYDQYQYGPIVQLHLTDTVANYISINYYIHHLTSSPEMVFATITKEILNFARYDNANADKIHKLFEEKVSKEIAPENSFIKEALQSGVIDFSYIFTDILRFGITYNFQFELFYYWFWTYNLQNASLYDKSGILAESHFQKELFRVLLIAEFFDQQISKHDCPIPELFTYWDRHFDSAKEEAKKIVDYLFENEISSELLDFLFCYLDKAYNVLLIDQVLPTGQGSSNIVTLLKHLRHKYKIIPPNEILKKADLIQKIFKDLTDRKNSYDVKSNSLLFIQWLMYDHLVKIYEGNGRQISIIRRNWDDGTPLESFINVASPHLYVADQTGGIFFDNVSKMNEYFRMSTAVMCELWDFSLKQKKQIIADQIHSLNENHASI